MRLLLHAIYYNTEENILLFDAFPGQKQLGEATETGIGNSGCVGDSHWSSVKELREGDKHLGDVPPAGGNERAHVTSLPETSEQLDRSL